MPADDLRRLDGVGSRTPRLRRCWSSEFENRGTRVFLGVPALYSVLLETPLTAIPDLSHIDYLLSCTAPLGVDLIERFHARFGIAICQHYGSSEVGAAANHVPSEVLAHPASVGKAMPGVELQIVDGEVVVSGTGTRERVSVGRR